MIVHQDLEVLARRFGLATILVASVLLFISPLLMRAAQGAPLTPGADSYKELRHADILIDNLSIGAGWSTIGWDQRGEKPFAPTPYAALLSLFGLFGVPWLLPITLFVLFIVLFWHALSRIVQSKTIVTLMLGLFIVAPSTTLLATHHTPIMLALVFLAAGLCLHDRSFLASLSFFGAALSDPAFVLPGLLAYIVVTLVRKQRSAAAGALFALILGILWHAVWLGPSALFALTPHPALMIYELGIINGISVFLLTFAAFGVVMHAEENADLIAWLFVSIILSVVIPYVLVYAVIALCLFAARGVHSLLTDEWQLELLQQILVILFVCSALFLTITSLRSVIQEDPTVSFSHTMITLRNQERPGNVLTSPRIAPLVEYFAERKATLSTQTSSAKVSQAFSRSPLDVYPLLEETHTSFIIVTKEMKDQNLGLLSLLQNTERFIKIQENGNVTLWYYLSTPSITAQPRNGTQSIDVPSTNNSQQKNVTNSTIGSPKIVLRTEPTIAVRKVDS